MDATARQRRATRALLKLLSRTEEAREMEIRSSAECVTARISQPRDILADADRNVALFVFYELHYSCLTGMDERCEWNPDLIGVRRSLEAAFEPALRAAVVLPPPEAATSDDGADILLAMTVLRGLGLSLDPPIRFGF